MDQMSHKRLAFPEQRNISGTSFDARVDIVVGAIISSKWRMTQGDGQRIPA
jgi:hypothetical protein